MVRSIQMDKMDEEKVDPTLNILKPTDSQKLGFHDYAVSIEFIPLLVHTRS